MQPAVHLAGPQCIADDSMPSESVHPGDEWGRAAPAVLLPGEGSSLLFRWAGAIEIQTDKYTILLQMSA